MSVALQNAKGKVDAILAQYQQAAALPALSMLGKVTAGKVYEAWVLCVVLRHLHDQEHFQATLVGGTEVRLKSSPGPINAAYPHFQLDRNGERFDVWTDVEFLTLSHALRGAPPPTPGDFHELDIIVVEHQVHGRPPHDRVVMGVECKNTPYTKDLLRAILGVRRELSLLADDQPTPFTAWPRGTVPASPPSCLLVFCTHAEVLNYTAPSGTFGIDFFPETPP